MARAYYPDGGGGYLPWTPPMIGSSDPNGLVQAASTNVDNIVDFAPKNQSFAGSVSVQDENGAWYNLLSIRHRNNTGDGPNYGMVLYAPLTYNTGNLAWRQQAGGPWGGERIIADSQNPEVVISSSQPTNPNAKVWVQI